MKNLKNLLIVFLGMFLSLNVLGQSYEAYQRFGINTIIYPMGLDSVLGLCYNKFESNGSVATESYTGDSIINVTVDDTLYLRPYETQSLSEWLITRTRDTITDTLNITLSTSSLFYDIALDTVSIQTGDTLKFQFYFYGVGNHNGSLPFVCVIRNISDTIFDCGTVSQSAQPFDTTTYTGIYALAPQLNNDTDTLFCETVHYLEVLQSPYIAFSNRVICQGDSVTVDTTDAISPFDWSDGTLGQYLTPTTSGNYSVTVTSTLGCTATDTAYIEVNPIYEIVENVTTYDISYELPDGSFVSTNGQYITVLQTVNGCDSTIITNLEFLTTSISSPVSEFNVNMYPNPTNDLITIELGSNYNAMNPYVLKIINTLSQVVYSTSINQNQTTVDLSTWTGTGIYFVHLIDDNGHTIDIRKIVLQ